METITQDNWREADLNVDSLWLIDERGKTGKHANVYHGNFIPQIPNQLIRRYTSRGDTVLELFSGSGTTLFECESLCRNYVGFDINTRIIEYVEKQMVGSESVNYKLCECDVTDNDAFERSAGQALNAMGIDKTDFMIVHPPYWDIVKFTQDIMKQAFQS